MQVMSEACCIFPPSGAFVDHASRFVDPALGFAIGENLGLEATKVPSNICEQASANSLPGSLLSQ